MNHAKDGFGIILEDDCCIDAECMQEACEWMRTHDTQAWDFILLGWHFFPSSTRTFKERQTIPHLAPLTSIERDFYGAHAYAVTRTGAQKALVSCLPIGDPCGSFLGDHHFARKNARIRVEEKRGHTMQSWNNPHHPSLYVVGL